MRILSHAWSFPSNVFPQNAAPIQAVRSLPGMNENENEENEENERKTTTRIVGSLSSILSERRLSRWPLRLARRAVSRHDKLFASSLSSQTQNCRDRRPVLSAVLVLFGQRV